MIDKERAQPTSSFFHKDCLAVVGMFGADVNQPRQPEALSVTDPRKACPRKDLLKTNAIPAEETGTETQA
jgi:hypothetical protein